MDTFGHELQYDLYFIMSVKDEKLITPILTYLDSLENTLEHHNDVCPLSDSDKKFIDKLLEVEISIMDDESFTSIVSGTEKIRKLYTSPPDTFEERQRAGQKQFFQDYKYQIKKQVALRKKAHAKVFPKNTPLEIHKKLIAIQVSGLQFLSKSMLEKRAEIERLNIEIERADAKIKEGLMAQAEIKKQELMDIMNQIGKSMNVSNLIKQTEKEMKPLKIATSKKAGKTYLTTAQKNLLNDLRPYFNRDFDGSSDWDGERLDSGDRQYFHENQFRNLADRYGMSVDGIKKFAQKHDPNPKKKK